MTMMMMRLIVLAGWLALAWALVAAGWHWALWAVRTGRVDLAELKGRLNGKGGK